MLLRMLAIPPRLREGRVSRVRVSASFRVSFSLSVGVRVRVSVRAQGFRVSGDHDGVMSYARHPSSPARG